MLAVSFRASGYGEWSLVTMSMSPDRSLSHRASTSCLRSQRRIALGPAAECAERFFGQYKVLHTRFAGRGHALAPVPANKVKRARDRAVHHVQPRTGPVGQLKETPRRLCLRHGRPAARVAQGVGFRRRQQPAPSADQ